MSIAFAKFTFSAFTYDAVGNRLSWRRRNGLTIGYRYDALNRETFRDYPVGSGAPNGTEMDVTTSYDILGRVLSKALGTDKTVSYVYDRLGQLTSTTDGNGRVLSYLYNAASARTQITYPDAVAFKYTLDALNRVTAITKADNTALIGLQYDDLGRRRTMTTASAALSKSYAFDGIGRLTSLTLDLSGTADDVSWTYAYNPASQVTSQTTNNTTYDDRETAASTVDRTYDGLNRDASIVAVAGGYDANGNLANEGAGGRAMVYDLDNRLISVIGTGANLRLEYDAEGRLGRVSSNGGTSWSSYLYDGVNLIGEYDTTGALVRRYVHGPGTDEPLVQFAGTQVASWSYFMANTQGSVMALASQTGVVSERYRYGAFGEPKDPTSFAAGSWTGSRFRYTGQTTLPEAKLYHYKARVYDPIYGRFLQTDPVGTKDDLNLYAYVGNDPVNHTDPTGKFCTWLNQASAYCDRSQRYADLDADPTISRQTRFFGAASLTTEALGSLDAPGAGIFASGAVRSFLSSMSTQLETANRGQLAGIRSGAFGSGPAADSRMVRFEQGLVQQRLDSLQQRDPKLYGNLVSSVNASLNGPAAQVDANYAKVLGQVKVQLGRDINFANRGDREAIGNALAAAVRSDSKVTCTGSRIQRSSC